MKVAIPWSIDKKNQYGDEYNITFKQSIDNFDKLFDFLLKYRDTRFNILIEDMPEQYIIAANEVNPHVYFRINNVKYLKNIDFFKNNNLKFFFNHSVSASCFTQLEELILLGITDVYIADDLCYNLEKTKKMCEKYGVRTRMVLNWIPSHRSDKNINPKTPYFIPEEIEELSKYIDVGEFESSSWTRINTYYKIWFQKQSWEEDLKFLYKDLELSIPNQSLIPNFLLFRMNCGYKCGYGSPCRKCEQFLEIAQDLANKNIEYNKPKKEKEG